jgi:hypothetical protein
MSALIHSIKRVNSGTQWLPSIVFLGSLYQVRGGIEVIFPILTNLTKKYRLEGADKTFRIFRRKQAPQSCRTNRIKAGKWDVEPGRFRIH